jgi:hypothetical protein
MTDHIASRLLLIESLKEELVGPSPQGQPLDCTEDIVFPDWDKARGPWRQEGTDEEILQRDTPCKRYGIGVLYPLGTDSEVDPGDLSREPAEQADSANDIADSKEVELVRESASKDMDKIAVRLDRDGPDPDDFDLTMANGFRPSAFGISFLCELPGESNLEVQATGGRYSKKTILISPGNPSNERDANPLEMPTADGEGRTRPTPHPALEIDRSLTTQKIREVTWWLRTPVTVRANFRAADLRTSVDKPVPPTSVEKSNIGHLQLEISALSRPYDDGRWLITLSLINRTPSRRATNETSLFQTALRASIKGREGKGHILPYPEPLNLKHHDLEKESYALLYREAQTFAVGHGCAANWGGGNVKAVEWVSTESLPRIETPSITPQVKRRDGTAVEVPMAPVAGLVSGDDGLAAVAEVIDLYEKWIEDQTRRLEALEDRYAAAGARHLQECKRVAARLRSGLQLLKTNETVRSAFRLANQAVLLQQLRTRTTPRVVAYENARFAFSESAPSLDWRAHKGRGNWRPFQIAFLLASLGSVADYAHAERDTIELLWFPTGGGKTEAYLGLAAFSIFYRRLRNPSDVGTEVLMRYTLRLLTTQQFQRAASLICAMEHIRRERSRAGVNDLGTAPFAIGIWVGMGSTPNDRAEARSILGALDRGDKDAENKFVLLKCPWCAAQMGPFENPKPERARRHKTHVPRIAGYERVGKTVAFRCPDTTCDFSDGIPVYVIDEDIYDERPALIIGTVDKFASLAWKPEARALFGLAPDGTRGSPPPGLIIQDELHLISGPLGSVVGLYEAAIEHLCTNKHQGTPARPKIVASTATIRRYHDQIKSLYARKDVSLFPPPGLDASDSFFAHYARDGKGSLSPGRVYVGVHGTGLGSVQTAQVRTFAALLQGASNLPEDSRDPWWTLVAFFNSLRELGTSLSLLQSDIPDYLKVLRNRLGLEPTQLRYLRHILELTGRMPSDEVPSAIEKLSTPYGSAHPVDVCLASNIIEAGIDIDRLSLMVVVGQPKSTSQYIQVTGRVGRLWEERPGLVAVIYSPTKPRDRSHFEKFRSYHQQLYAQVEPTSVTPFAPPVLIRALHAVLVSDVRQNGPLDLAPYPVPEKLLAVAANILRERVELVDPLERGALEEVLRQRVEEWRAWQRRNWSDRSQDIPLLRRAGEYASRLAEQLSWATPTSMRNVDAECQAEITHRYILSDVDDNA